MLGEVSAIKTKIICLILEKNKDYLKKLYFGWIEYFETWDLSDYDENDLIAFIEDLEKHITLKKTSN